MQLAQANTLVTLALMGGTGCIGGVCTGVTSVNSANAGEGLLGAHIHGMGKKGECFDVYPFPDDCRFCR